MPSAIQNKKGFTLIEIMAAISILFIILAVTLSVGRSFNDSVNLRNASKNVDSKIRLAKSRSIGALNDTNYGVHFESARVVVYDASVPFDDADLENEVLTLPDNVEINIADVILEGGGVDLVFKRLTGDTDNYGSVRLRVISDPSNTEQIFINADGQSSFSSFQTSSGPTIANGRHVHFDLGVWDISQINTELKLEWVENDAFENPILSLTPYDISAYFNAGKFDWEETIDEAGIYQKLRIHSWIDPITNHTILCVLRDQTEEDKLYISIIGSGCNGIVASYTNAGAVKWACAETMDVQ